jgi:peptidyl-prolyl cis-trans isomerase B (cyclophilin B)
VPDTLPADRVTPDAVTYHRATVSMANAGPNTNGSQFFFTYKDCQIPDAFTPFGQVTAGMSIIDKVAKNGVFDEYGISEHDGEPRIKLSFKSVTVTDA